MLPILILLAVLTAGYIAWTLFRKHQANKRRQKIAGIAARFASDELVLRAIHEESIRLLDKIQHIERNEHLIYIKASINIVVSQEWICDLHLNHLGHADLNGGEVIVIRDLIADKVRTQVWEQLHAAPPARDSDIRLVSDHGWIEYTARNGYAIGLECE